MKKLLLTILKSALFFLIWAVLVPLIPDIPTQNGAYLRLWYEFIPFVVIVALTFIFTWFVERKNIRVPIYPNLLKNTAIGLGVGVLWLGIPIGMMLLLRVLRFEGVNQVSFLPVWIFACFLNVVMQELLVRGYLYQLLKTAYNRWTAILCTTLLFVLLHGGAFEAGPLAVLNVITMSLLMSLLLECTGTLAAPIAVHFLWNAVGSIVLGAVSLAEDYPHIFITQFQGSQALSGGSYRLEGSILVFIMNCLLSAVLLWMLMRQGKKGTLA